MATPPPSPTLLHPRPVKSGPRLWTPGSAPLSAEGASPRPEPNCPRSLNIKIKKPINKLLIYKKHIRG